MASTLLLVIVTGVMVLAGTGILGEPAEHMVRNETSEVRPPIGDLLPPVGPRAEVWAVGDADASAEAGELAAQVEAASPDRLLYLGDVYEYGSAASFEAWSHVWGGIATRTAPTPGNHDWGESREGYDPYWRRVHGRPIPSYYSLRAGGWEFISLNSEAPHGSGSPQERWLARRLERQPGDCRVVFWHRPRYNAGMHGDDATMEPLWSRLPGHARAVLSGHDHSLQRLRPAGGVVQFVVGSGGHGHHPVDRKDPRLEFADDRHAGALRMIVEPRRLSWSFVAAGGAVLDSGTLGCSRD